MRTLRFLLIARAGRLTRIAGRNVFAWLRTQASRSSTPGSHVLSPPELFAD
jgi:hypothetical protein